MTMCQEVLVTRMAMVGSREVLVVRMMASSWELSVRVLVARMAMTDGQANLEVVTARVVIAGGQANVGAVVTARVVVTSGQVVMTGGRVVETALEKLVEYPGAQRKQTMKIVIVIVDEKGVGVIAEV
jgi:hypothetical protein